MKSSVVGHPESLSDAESLCRLLASHRYTFQDEVSLQNGIEQVLRSNGVAYKREHVLDTHSRPDFLVGQLVIEVKIKGSCAQFLRQAHRYLFEHDEVGAVIAVGTPAWISLLPNQLADKPLFGVRLLNSML